MQIRRFANAEEFLEATKTFRSADAVRTRLISSIAISVANGSRTYDSYFWLVAGLHQIRTPPTPWPFI